MNEADTRVEYIEPALKKAGWGVIPDCKILREYHITTGRLQGSGIRKAPLIADYVLIYKNHKLAVIEAKSNDSNYTQGVAQAKQYAQKLEIRFAYSTNGSKIYSIDMNTAAEKDIDNYPTPDELWNLTFPKSNEWMDKFNSIEFEDKGEQWMPRYYQDLAINKVLRAIANRQKRILLTLATGTGKTCIAFQIAWKLFHSRWNINDGLHRTPKILFLADRNILANQAFNAFSPFPEDALKRIDPYDIRKRGKVPTNGSIFFTIFQTFMSGSSDTAYFGEYPQDFFDLIIIDECHRGGANDQGSWRAILEYFSQAYQLGLTATPKRKDNIDTYKYFGEPVYSYSLKEGINDGFLTPFRVQQIHTTLDEYIYAPDDDLLEGSVEIGQSFVESDFNRNIIIKEREAKRVKVFMDLINQNEKTIVFCANQDHALLVRDLINQYKQSSNPDYCVRVTSDEGKIGEEFLKTFQDNERTIPTILTTSQKLSTGVDALNIRNIVLMKAIKSMIEFKQIIGRGTRLYDNKNYFTIYDFVEAYKLFYDPEWDGEPIEKIVKNAIPNTSSPIKELINEYLEKKIPNQKIRIKLADGKERFIQHMICTSFFRPDGGIMTAQQFLTSLYGKIPELFKNENELRAIWSKPDTRKALLNNLAEKGYGKEQLKEMQKIIEAENSDLFDVLAYIAFANKPLTRTERVEKANPKIQSHFNTKQQAFLDFVLDQYIKEGVEELDQEKLVPLLKLKYKAIPDAKPELGEIFKIKELFENFQKYLYQDKTG